MAKYIKFRDNLSQEAPIWSKRINQCLIENNMTQGELAIKSNISSASITAWIKGDKNGNVTEPKVLGLLSIANALGVSTDYLLGNVDIKSADPDIQAICRKTGLTEKSVNYLIGDDRDQITEMIDIMVENENTENKFVGFTEVVMEISEQLLAEGFPKVNPEDLKLLKIGTREYADLFEGQRIYKDNFMYLELLLFKMQTRFYEMMKKVVKLDDIGMDNKWSI